ncbi:cupin domain-containing protein [Mesorhizobium captivum]|uniref:cupin domain-containing protein n=1 Tax=Mesorhizobium captivum TaxID=3072319 RepID=UPI002A24EF6A|nr:cupin domain-containing protein [Mesorhizobium sp. VK23E]MDX8512528.1 cupin domain-containing protein [Mesorhizobium sp. VK23E]
MAEAAMDVTKLESKSHNNPDEVRSPAKTRVEIVRLPGYTLGRLNMEPGWKWSECVKPVVKTDSCQVSHVGYVVSGTITVRMNDGTEKTFTEGTSYTIPPGHDAWVVGNQPFQCIECSAQSNTPSRRRVAAGAEALQRPNPQGEIGSFRRRAQPPQSPRLQPVVNVLLCSAAA